jgi:hypothetical protein
MVSRYCYRVYFEDGGDVTTKYVGTVLQVGDSITLEREHWIITDAKVLSERDVDFEISVRRAEEGDGSRRPNRGPRGGRAIS